MVSRLPRSQRRPWWAQPKAHPCRAHEVHAENLLRWRWEEEGEVGGGEGEGGGGCGNTTCCPPPARLGRPKRATVTPSVRMTNQQSALQASTPSRLCSLFLPVSGQSGSRSASPQPPKDTWSGQPRVPGRFLRVSGPFVGSHSNNRHHVRSGPRTATFLHHRPSPQPRSLRVLDDQREVNESIGVCN